MIETILAAGAVISVLAAGGTNALWFASVRAAILVTAVAVFWKRGLPPIGWPSRTLLLLLVVVPLFQIAPLPEGLLGILSPARTEFAANLPELRLSTTLSVYPYETTVALLRLVSYVLVFLLAYQATLQRGNGRVMANTLVALALLESVFGITQYLTSSKNLFVATAPFTDYASGTYTNRNHFAGLLEMGLPFLVANILLGSGRRCSRTRSRWVEVVTSPLASKLLRDTLLAAILLLALVFSKSRMGLAGGVAAILVVSVIALLRDPRRRTWLSVLAILGVTGAYAWWIGLDPIFRRFAALGEDGALERDRLPIWRDTLSLISDYPWFGTGLGTYTWSSFHYQTHFLSQRYVHAHNDYLEFAADLGIPLAALLLVGLWILAIRIARIALKSLYPANRIVAAGCAGAMTSLLIHGLADFNLQIPANAYLFSWIAGTAAALTSDQFTQREERRTQFEDQIVVRPLQAHKA